MAAIRSADEIARKWALVTPQRAPDYEAGIRNPKADWAQQTTAAAETWKTAITRAVAEGRFSKGVQRAGTSTWQEGALSKGVARWGPGVQLAEEKFERGFAPFREAIARVVLPPRFARRDPRNLLRVSAITEALAKVKASQ